MAADSPLFLDTNVLLCATDTTREHHEESIALLRAAGIPLSLSGQVLREYLAVATRPPEVNGLGLDPAGAISNVEQVCGRAALLEETERVWDELVELVRRHSLKGKRIHDANIAATAIVHGQEGIATLNPSDFDFLNDEPEHPRILFPAQALAIARA
ncbi:MAG: PIN domain-containing protein [Polyangia bacterium]